MAYLCMDAAVQHASRWSYFFSIIVAAIALGAILIVIRGRAGTAAIVRTSGGAGESTLALPPERFARMPVLGGGEEYPPQCSDSRCNDTAGIWFHIKALDHGTAGFYDASFACWRVDVGAETGDDVSHIVAFEPQISRAPPLDQFGLAHHLDVFLCSRSPDHRLSSRECSTNAFTVRKKNYLPGKGPCLGGRRGVWAGEEGYHWASPGTPPPLMAASQAFPKCRYASLPVAPFCPCERV